ncbi:uncharacterized protein LOC131067560 isoform X2 [Cryptomeria japonica]|uniref:uncharacterized protein LOC131067560 isoform X2 n=1 Tax=Cryptomeria japonica TaxID=3369 RepID=UPI0027D9E507|nr:uncharacterized protein LOC131067560 isoform X2 [Cryptomeria japonica]
MAHRRVWRLKEMSRAKKTLHPMPPNPPKKAFPMSLHGKQWEDSYHWMSNLDDKVAMRHMKMLIEQEHNYTEAVMSDTLKLQHRLQFEMASRMYNDLCSPPLRWGPWVYYKRIAQGKAYPVLCRRLASANEEFSWNNTPSSGFDFKTGQKIEQKLLDFNEVAQQSGGFAYEDMCEISPDHRFIAYSIYVMDKGFFTLCVKDLNTGSLHHKPKVDRIDTLAWSKNGLALFYTVLNNSNRPSRAFCRVLESSAPDTLLMEEFDDTAYLTIRGTKDYQFITVTCSSSKSLQVYILDTMNLGAGLHKVWECDPNVHCLLEHHQGYLYMFTDAPRDGNSVDGHYLLRRPVGASKSDNWENVFIDEPHMKIEDIDFFTKHLVLTLRKGRIPGVCSVELPLPLDLMMPEAVVDYNLLSREWVIIQQEDLRLESTQVLYGRFSSSNSRTEDSDNLKSVNKFATRSGNDHESWNDLSDLYACENCNVYTMDKIYVPLTVVYSRKKKQHGQNPGLLYGHGAYGEVLDKRWRSELKSLLDCGWVIAFADVRGGGGGGKSWHHEGRASKKLNSIHDYIACAKFLIEQKYVHHSKLAAWGYGAGGLLVGAAINIYPDLFCAAVLKYPFFDAVSSLLNTIIPLRHYNFRHIDYEEFGDPTNPRDFENILSFSPYENIQRDVTYPAVLITSTLKTVRFGYWQAVKWIAKVREYTNKVPSRPVLLNINMDFVEDNRYLHCKTTALEHAFLVKMTNTPSNMSNQDEEN